MENADKPMLNQKIHNFFAFHSFWKKSRDVNSNSIQKSREETKSKKKKKTTFDKSRNLRK